MGKEEGSRYLIKKKSNALRSYRSDFLQWLSSCGALPLTTVARHPLQLLQPSVDMHHGLAEISGGLDCY